MNKELPYNAIDSDPGKRCALSGARHRERQDSPIASTLLHQCLFANRTMKTPRTAFWVYLLGIMLLRGILGAYESRLRAALGDWPSFAAVVAYLIVLRFIAEFIERKRHL
jgi:hypothetical protein